MTIHLVMLAMLLLPAMAMAQQPQQPQQMSQPPGSTPVPDPTVLTTQAQKAATEALRELLEAKIAGLQHLVEEKFAGVNSQFSGRDVALAAALLAQKTSVEEQNKANAASSAKAEAGTTKQIDSILAIINANAKSTDDKIASVGALSAAQATDLRNSVTELRTTIAAITSRGAGQSDLWAYMVGAAGLLLAFFGFARSWLHNAQQQQSPPPNWYPPPQYQPQYQQPPPPPPQVSVVPVVPVSVPNNGHR